MAIYRLPFDDDSAWEGGANWDDPGGGHGAGQAYAFDLGHPVGGNIRAARGGQVVFVENNDGNTNIDNTVPGYGTAILIRHWDNTVAAYDHLKFKSTKVKNEQFVLQGEIIALSGNTGQSSGPHLHFDLRTFWNSPSDHGPTIPVQFEDKNHVAWRPKKGDVLASNNSILRQEEWRWCEKCQGLFFAGAPIAGTVGGKCPAGGLHTAIGTGNYILALSSNAPGQSDWRWCSKCQGLFFGGNPGPKCPAGGEHTKSGSGNYVIVNNSPNDPGQPDWRWCKKCQGLFFGGHPGSKCPAGGEHSKTGSGNYSLAQMGSGEAQPDWRWCSKCKGLFFAGNPGSKCPAEGEHSKVGSANYVLVHDYTSPNAPGQENWRWCNKCRGLFFGGNPGSKCPGGGAHSKTNSGNYVLVQNAPNAPGEKDWRWCNKCQGLFFGGGAGSKCPAGGAHSNTGSGNYSLLL